MGDGRVQNEVSIKIDVPAGVNDGNYMTMRNDGNAGKRGGPAGDLIVVFKEIQHEYFAREGDDILYDLFVSYPEAALGGEVEVPTLNGKAKLKIDSGTPSGKLLKMRDKGIKHLNHSGKGDQIVRVNIAVPKKLNSKEKELLKERLSSPNIKSSSGSEEKNFFKRFRL